ncbi:AF4/FMR2 family member lilli [Drosophila takahashii]|uniref:AF4/FMR2 family member lilli n=1 Tax=Drosophila takahashii TaxID=29030 RepID=UPI001CF8E012|nr:deoxynucleotidyltransferase terminal-interacting protein 1 [Drosophila takahashii]
MVIQRSWKIPTDVGGSLSSSGNNNTSAANEVQQRSSPGIQLQAANSSSDDSDCSNQTTHSMDTRVASPPLEGVRKQAEKEASAEGNTITLSLLGESTSSDAEASQKYVTTPEMAENMLQRIRQRLGGSHNTESGGSAESAMRALELLRISVQQAFDAEVNEIIKRYMQNYFKPAFGNIKENLGQHSVNEETLQKMSSCALLENAKAQYTNFVRQQQRQALKRTAKQEISPVNKVFVATKPMPCTATTENQNPQPAVQPQQLQQQELQTVQPLQQTQAPNQQPHRSTVTPLVGGTLPTPVRRQIFWNTAQISTTTKFVLDVQANLAFGFGTDGKERLASKHPELIRYLPDGEDREWLATRGIIPAENRSSRFLFLIYDEVCRLQQTHDLYRHKSNIDLSMMLTFSVTDAMIHKMRLFFVDLNIKSRGLITNSYIMPSQQQSGNANNSHLRNALLQGASAQQQQQQQQQVATPPSEEAVLKDLPAASPTPCLQGQVVGSTTTPLKTKLGASSTLSSSHATLTALLNNGGVVVAAAPAGNSAPSTIGKFRN